MSGKHIYLDLIASDFNATPATLPLGLALLGLWEPLCGGN